jgi:hypothetical protein
MARTKRTTEVIDHAADAGALVPVANHALEVERNARVNAFVMKYGDGLPWEPTHYESEIRNEMRHGCESFARAGRLLIVAKEASTHGEWAGIIDRLGLEPRQAQRMMEAARRLAALPNASTSTHLMKAAGSNAKLIELLSLPEDQFVELAETGETGELALDDVASMTVRELRMALREAREDNKAKGDRIAKHVAEVERLETDLRKTKQRIKTAKPSEVAKDLVLEIEKALIGAETHLKTIFEGLQQLLQDDTHQEVEAALARVGMGLVAPTAEVLACLSSMGVKSPAQSLCAGLEDAV